MSFAIVASVESRVAEMEWTFSWATGVSCLLVGSTGGNMGVVRVSTAPSMSDLQTLARRDWSTAWMPPFALTSSARPREWTFHTALLLRPFYV
jgi:hypothetical protein